jgi:hypothetical protein
MLRRKTIRVAETAPECRADDARTAGRASIYLAATLYCDGCASPAKIRNISATGALLDSAVVPSVGALVQLVRGRLIVHGLVIWALEGRCGLKFSGSVDVQEWRATPLNMEQQRVDEVVRLVRAGAVPLPVPPLGHSSELDEMTGPASQRSADLRRVSDLLEDLVEVLAGDAEVVARHGPALQNLDIAMQVLAAIDADSLADGDIQDPEKLPGLRRSADLALRARRLR